MSKTAKTVRTIISILIFAGALFLLYLDVTAIFQIVGNKENGGALYVLVLIAYAIYAIPFVLAILIYQIVMIAKKKIYKLELTASIIAIVAWVLMFLIPLILQLFV